MKTHRAVALRVFCALLAVTLVEPRVRSRPLEAVAKSDEQTRNAPLLYRMSATFWLFAEAGS